MEADMNLLKQENDSLKNENEKLRTQLEEMKNKNLYLVDEIENCHKEISEQIAVLTSIKAEIRRYEVQLNTLKSETAEFKNKVVRIANNPIGKILINLYRNIREIKYRIKD